MARSTLILLAVALAACGSKKKSDEAAPPSPAGSGSAVAPEPTKTEIPVKVVPLEWKTPGGERLISLRADGGFEGPCGPVGTLSGGQIKIGGQTLAWTGVERNGKTYRVAPLPWTITVGAGGAVTLTNPGHPETPLGTVTGVDTEDGARLFAALVLAAPSIQITLSFAPAEGGDPFELTGSADLDAWQIKRGATVVATKKRDDKAPEAKHPFSEAPDGKVTVDGKVIGTLAGRLACTPHDKAAAALIETYLAKPR